MGLTRHAGRGQSSKVLVLGVLLVLCVPVLAAFEYQESLVMKYGL